MLRSAMVLAVAAITSSCAPNHLPGEAESVECRLISRPDLHLGQTVVVDVDISSDGMSFVMIGSPYCPDRFMTLRVGLEHSNNAGIRQIIDAIYPQEGIFGTFSGRIITARVHGEVMRDEDDEERYFISAMSAENVQVDGSPARAPRAPIDR